MRTAKRFALFCIMCLLCQPFFAQRRVRLADLPPFERVVVVVKYFEGLHGKDCYPYVGYGHQLQPDEHFSPNMSERQADSLLRADLWKCFEHFTGYGKDALLLAVLSLAAEDRVGRQEYLQRICLILPTQRQSPARSCQTAKGGVCPVLLSLNTLSLVK